MHENSTVRRNANTKLLRSIFLPNMTDSISTVTMINRWRIHPISTPKTAPSMVSTMFSLYTYIVTSLL